MATILCSGGAGFIGSHCIKILLGRGDTVICVDNFSRFIYSPDQKLENIKPFIEHKNFYLYNTDITNQDAMTRIFATHKIDKILHLAAQAGVRASLNHPLVYVRDNINGTAMLLELARLSGIKYFVMASSSSVYGENKKIPFSENDEVNHPVSPYAATKRACEVLAYNYHHIAGIKMALLRYFTVYGPGNRPDMAIYKFSEKIMSGLPIIIYGTEMARDWSYVEDIATGTIKALDSIQTMEYEIFNIGCGRPIKVTDFITLLSKELGREAKIEIGPVPIGEVPITHADTHKIEERLGWKPTTPVEEGIKKFVSWFKKHYNLLDNQQIG
ncbi:MAG: GDP-mannose 4,6-dehydratase [bacterium]|nr:GDP-mannose 4,6-dehydratase [bacterium]